MKLRYPLDKIFITQHFGERPEVYKPLEGHDGIDFRTKFDDSPDSKRIVMAAAPGIVKEAPDQKNKGYGKYIRLQHDDGSQTVYGHLTTWYVKPGDRVTEGEKIGLSGNTGFSSAPHLHFGYRPTQYDVNNGFNGYVDPLPFLEKTAEPSNNELYSTPLSLLKKKNEPAIYLYGYDQTWYPLHDMSVLKILTGPYDTKKTTVVDELPSNISAQTIFLE